MRARTLEEIAAAVGGQLDGPDATVTDVVIDSRRAKAGSLFVALSGERTDGHRHVLDAIRRGAAGAVVRVAAGGSGRRGAAGGESSIVVPDPAHALLALAAHERRELDATVIGITGSVGKTATKDFAAAVLSRRLPTHSSPRSFNNRIGLPLTILGAPPETRALVCELGAGRVGDIACLCRVATPAIGIVTAVGMAHLETFGSPSNIVQAKGELVEALPPKGIVILNADDTAVRGLRLRTRATVVTFGRALRAGVRAERIALDDLARPAFTIRAGRDRARVRLRVPGIHMVANALAAACCGLALGIPLEECAAGIGEARVSPGRMEVVSGGGELRLVHDAYNANPTSVAAAMVAARAMAGAGRWIAVLGEMAELGPFAPEQHSRMGTQAARLGAAELVVVGQHAGSVAAGACEVGLSAQHVHAVESTDEAAEVVRAVARRGDVVLVKGSRVAGLERVVEALRAPPARLGSGVAG
jgi:UDP-N-acetylmuramoyl-tripeptide--D-alanyl-D-alanine ligase